MSRLYSPSGSIAQFIAVRFLPSARWKATCSEPGHGEWSLLPWPSSRESPDPSSGVETSVGV